MPTQDELDFVADDDTAGFVPDTDVGPEARRAQQGKPAAPKSETQSDEDLGIASPPQFAYTETYGGQKQGTAAPPNATILPGGTPYQHGVTDSPLHEDPIARTIVTGILGHGAGAVVGAGAKALGAGEMLGNTAAGAAGGATASKLGGGSAAAGALAGGALSGMMSFAGRRAAEQMTKAPFQSVARKGTEAEQEALVAQGHRQVGEVMNRFGIGKLNNPVVAKAAVDKSVAQAQATLTTARDAAHNAAPGSELAKQAASKVADAERDLATLKAIQPITNRLATSHELRMSFAERLAQQPIQAGRDAVNKVVAAPLRAGMAPISAADKALAQLYKLRAQGQLITPELIAAATTAGVNPRLLDQFNPGANNASR